MKKPKIAISLDKSLLDLIDSRVDGSIIRSRSQAIEYFLKKGLQEMVITKAVILLKGEHQAIALKEIKGAPLIKKQIDFLHEHGVKTVYIVTQHSKKTALFRQELADVQVEVHIIEKETKGNAAALLALKDQLRQSFIVMSGDIYNKFNLIKMIRKHVTLDKLATMGLMSRGESSAYGNAILDGEFIIDFQEKPKQSTTNIVNAGIYIFKPEIFELFENATSLEKDIFPKLARIKQLVGFFTYGEYQHVE